MARGLGTLTVWLNADTSKLSNGFAYAKRSIAEFTRESNVIPGSLNTSTNAARNFSSAFKSDGIKSTLRDVMALESRLVGMAGLGGRFGWINDILNIGYRSGNLLGRGVKQGGSSSIPMGFLSEMAFRKQEPMAGNSSQRYIAQNQYAAWGQLGRSDALTKLMNSSSGIPAASTAAMTLSSGLRSVLGLLGPIGAMGATAFAGWHLGKLLSDITGIKEAFESFYDVQGKMEREGAAIGKSGETNFGRNNLTDAIERSRIANRSANEKAVEDLIGANKRTEAIQMMMSGQRAFEFNLNFAKPEAQLKMIEERLQRLKSLGNTEEVAQMEYDALNKKRSIEKQMDSEKLKAEEEKTKHIEELQDELGKKSYDIMFRNMSKKEQLAELNRRREILNQNEVDFNSEEGLNREREKLDINEQIKALNSEENANLKPQPTTRQESSSLAAVQRGTLEALKLENTRTSKDDKIESNTRKTAKATEKIAKSIDKIAGAASVNFEVEDAFAL